jgi:hypothetical protein
MKYRHAATAVSKLEHEHAIQVANGLNGANGGPALTREPVQLEQVKINLVEIAATKIVHAVEIVPGTIGEPALMRDYALRAPPTATPRVVACAEHKAEHATAQTVVAGVNGPNGTHVWVKAFAPRGPLKARHNHAATAESKQGPVRAVVAVAGTTGVTGAPAQTREAVVPGSLHPTLRIAEIAVAKTGLEPALQIVNGRNGPNGKPALTKARVHLEP